MAESVVHACREAEPQRDVRVVIQPGLTVQGDRRLLRIALENLFGNAWKFTRGRDQARIEFGGSDGPGATVYSVVDNGVGFDMAYADRLFGAFQRLHSAEEFDGTGIGLATVRRVVRRHGGRVWANSQAGKGAAFHFTLAPSTSDQGELS